MSIFSNRKDIVSQVDRFQGWPGKLYQLSGSVYFWSPQPEWVESFNIRRIYAPDRECELISVTTKAELEENKLTLKIIYKLLDKELINYFSDGIIYTEYGATIYYIQPEDLSKWEIERHALDKFVSYIKKYWTEITPLLTYDNWNSQTQEKFIKICKKIFY